MNLLFLLGRIICGGFFVSAGANHFKEMSAFSEYARSKGTPAPSVAVGASGAMLLAGGFSLIGGVEPVVGIGLLVVFLLVVSIQMHAFWSVEDQREKANELVNFTKNLGLIGALLMMLGIPRPWPWSF